MKRVVFALLLGLIAGAGADLTPEAISRETAPRNTRHQIYRKGYAVWGSSPRSITLTTRRQRGHGLMRRDGRSVSKRRGLSCSTPSNDCRTWRACTTTSPALTANSARWRWPRAVCSTRPNSIRVCVWPRWRTPTWRRFGSSSKNYESPPCASFSRGRSSRASAEAELKRLSERVLKMH